MGSKMHPQDQLRDVCCHLANMIEDIHKTSFAYDIMSRAISPLSNYFDPCHTVNVNVFYHLSAKRGLVIACRLSFCLSVCDVGGL